MTIVFHDASMCHIRSDAEKKKKDWFLFIAQMIASDSWLTVDGHSIRCFSTWTGQCKAISSAPQGCFMRCIHLLSMEKKNSSNRAERESRYRRYSIPLGCTRKRRGGGLSRELNSELRPGCSCPRRSWTPCPTPCRVTELQELVSVRSHATSPDLLLHLGHTTNHEYLQRQQPPRPVLP